MKCLARQQPDEVSRDGVHEREVPKYPRVNLHQSVQASHRSRDMMVPLGRWDGMALECQNRRQG